MSEYDLLVEKYEKAANNNDFETALSACEELALKYGNGYEYEFPDLCIKAKKYNKTVEFINKRICENEQGINYFLLAEPMTVTRLGIAYKHLSEYEQAIDTFELVILTQKELLETHPDASGSMTSNTKLLIALSYSYLGEIYVSMSKTTYAYDCFINAEKYTPTVSSIYNIALFHLMGIEVKKNINKAISDLSKIAELPANDGSFTDDEIELIAEANEILATQIYACEEGFRNKEKAKQCLKKAQNLGRPYSNIEINNICYDIISDDNNDYSPNHSSASYSSNTSNSSSSQGCYVATSVYGSYDCPQVWTLRRYRDNQLSKSRCGRLFIRAYYAVSPIIVKYFGETQCFKKMWQNKLDIIVEKLQKKGFESTPYNDMEW